MYTLPLNLTGIKFHSYLYKPVDQQLRITSLHIAFSHTPGYVDER